MKVKNTTLALICACFILILEVLALIKGVDGIALSVSIGAIAGLGGYGIGTLIKKIKGN